MAGEEKQNKTKQTHMRLKQLQENYVVSAWLQCGPQIVCIRIEWILRKMQIPMPCHVYSEGQSRDRAFAWESYILSGLMEMNLKAHFENHGSGIFFYFI